MRSTHALPILIAATALALAARPAGAHFFPVTAKNATSSLVQNYPPCTSPNATSSTGQPACEGPAEVDPSCVFSAKGKGTLSATIKGTSIAVKAMLKGLDSTCNGKTLRAALTMRTTSDTCPNDHCTSVDRELVTSTSCTVANGKCTIKDTLASGFPSGAGSEMTILTCGVKNGALQTFSCGIMVK